MISGHEKRILTGLLVVVILSLGIAMVVQAATVEVDFETFPDGTPTSDGQLLHDQYESEGFVFEPPESESAGAVITKCGVESDDCKWASSGEMVVESVRKFEFDKHPLRINFTQPRRSVSFNYSIAQRDVSVVHFEVKAYGEDGSVIETQSHRTLLSWGVWFESALGDSSGPAEISEIEITLAREVDDTIVQDNLILIDDLSHTGPEIESEPDEDDPPAVNIRSPEPGERIDETTGEKYTIYDPPPRDDLEEFGIEYELAFTASDDTQLKNVTIEVLDPDGEMVTSRSVCGSEFDPCPPGSAELNTTLNQTYEQNGVYTLTLRACDTSNQCIEQSRSNEVLVPESETIEKLEPYAHRVEISQGVQNELLSFTPPATPADDPPTLPLVPNKDTVVRFYLFSDVRSGERSPGGDLEVIFSLEDGSTERTVITPNTNQSRVEIPEMPSTDTLRQRKLREMRTDLNMSLNFVIPRDEIPQGAETMQIRIPGLTGPLPVEMDQGPTLGMRIVGLYNDTYSPPDPNRVKGLVTLHRYLMPASDIKVASVAVGGGDTLGSSADIVSNPIWINRTYTGSKKCGKVLSWLRSTYAGDFFAFKEGDKPDFTVTIGLERFGSGMLQGCLGKAYASGIPTAVSSTDTNVAPQEIMHTMGITHASRYHGVKANNEDWEAWPYQHGQLSASSTYTGGRENFGVVPNRTGDGEYELVLIDPCPTDDPALRNPCSLSDSKQRHDFMSYGSFEKFPELEGLFEHPSFRWSSDITYVRMYNAMMTGDLRPESGSLPNETLESFGGTSPLEPSLDPVLLSSHEPGEARTEGYMVAGRVLDDGSLELDQPLLRKQLPESMVHSKESRESEEYVLELIDDDGGLLVRHHFDVTPTSNHGDDTELFWEAIPYVDGAERLVVESDDGVVLDERASPNEPVVEITSPNGGEILNPGTHTIRWEASDPDGDSLTHLVQYSKDGGQSWQGITTVMPGEPNEVEIPVDAFPPGQRAVIRVTTSDGFNTGVDVSDRYFSLGTNASPREGETDYLLERFEGGDDDVETETTTETEMETDGDDGPGFGLVAGILALSVIALLLVNRRT